MKRAIQVQITEVGSSARATESERLAMLNLLREKALAAEGGVAARIAEKQLYLRVSVIGACDLACAFCHNEGGPGHGRIDESVFGDALSAAAVVGFTRVQLTGGEPLLDPRIARLVGTAVEHMSDVGITTNGSRLAKTLPDLISAGITRVHVSLQNETLTEQGGLEWSLPDWLDGVVSECAENGIALRFNVPVAPGDVETAGRLFARPGRQFSANVFALLRPLEASDGTNADYLDSLRSMVARSDSADADTRVSMRSHMTPAGHRCDRCRQRPLCTEASRSLRLGVDRQLRPCLATRYWDTAFRRDDPVASITEATYFALDY